MSGYAPPSALALGWLVASLSAAAALGLLAARAPRPGPAWRAVGWGLLLAVTLSGVAASAAEPGGNRLLLLCMGMFLSFKALVTVETRLTGRPCPRGPRWLAFAFLWPGMRPQAFASLKSGRRPGSGRLMREGLLAVGLGGLLLLAARGVGPRALHGVPGTLLALSGLGFVLHVGSFRALAGFWRWRGAAVVPLFDAPHRARSLQEFWGRRWNLAFSEMLQVALRRPLTPRLGASGSGAAIFLVSGALHEVALSVPGQGGYGLPLLYFALHGVLVQVEPRLAWLRSPRHALAQRLWTLGWAVLPAVLVFHPAALRAAVLPLVG